MESTPIIQNFSVRIQRATTGPFGGVAEALDVPPERVISPEDACPICGQGLRQQQPHTVETDGVGFAFFRFYFMTFAGCAPSSLTLSFMATEQAKSPNTLQQVAPMSHRVLTLM